MLDHLPLAVRDAAERELPQSMIDAQHAIRTPEVQAIIRELAKHNLAVCMPHMHAVGEFVEQPADVVQVEIKSDFVSTEMFASLGTLPVSWRWHEGRVTVTGSCHVLHRKCD
ncbi:hypothetical protein [Pseudonocardia xishanensis]|uniref:Uncharacterized protein n=1 Tax=Pseudonocardia xishanensis TaxID=630995 RepID=A0ABP8RC08_9PSEU